MVHDKNNMISTFDNLKWGEKWVEIYRLLTQIRFQAMTKKFNGH